MPAERVKGTYPRKYVEVSGGGGTSDHATLSHLAWASSAHTGTASRLAWFDSGGSASHLSLGTGLTTSGSSLVVDTSVIATVASVAAGYQPLNSALTSISGGTWVGSTSITTVGTIVTGTWNGTAISIGYGGTGSTTASGARTNLGLAIGTDVQAYDAGLASLTSADASAGLPYVSAADTWASATYSGMLSVVSGAWKVIGWRESGGQDLTNGAISDGQLVARVGTTVAGVNVSATPTASYVVKADGSGKVDGWVSDATSGTKGKIQLAGDLGGTASSPTVTQARGLRETSGPTTIPIGTIRDGEFLTYAGGVITSAAVNAAVLIFLSEGFDDSNIGGVLDAPPDIIAISDGSDI